MSEIAISIDRVSRMFRRYRHPRYQLLEALGMRAPAKSYDEFWALRNISIRMARGDRVGIIGRNGAGKSTLLSIVCGRLQPTSGTARVNGRIQALMELGTGFHPEFTGRQNVLTSLAYQGITGRKAQALLEEVFDFAELDDFIDQPVKTYSTGMYARLAFTTSTVLEPDILIIDEVLGAGDAYFAAKSSDRMRRLTIETGATVLFVSHDLSAVERLCDRAVWIDRGQVKMEGSTLDVSKSYYAAVLEQEEERLRAKTSQAVSRLRREVAQTVGDADGELHLFRFATLDGEPPRQAHPIRRIALVLADGRTLEVTPGGAMDNDSNQPAYLLTDPQESLWGAAGELDGHPVRHFEETGGVYPQAALCFRLPPGSLAEPARLVVEHAARPGERVALDVRVGADYRCVGLLDPAPAGWRSQQFALDMSRFHGRQPAPAECELRTFRLVVADGSRPRLAHPVRRIAVVLAQGETVELCLGSAFDADPREPAYLVADPGEILWSEPVEFAGSVVRRFEDTGGRYPQAPVFFRIPAGEIAAGARLLVEHAARPEEPVSLELLEEGEYRSLGLLEAPDGGWAVEEFSLDGRPALEAPPAAAVSAAAVSKDGGGWNRSGPGRPAPEAAAGPPLLRDRWETKEARFLEIFPCKADTLARKHSFGPGEDIAFRAVAEFTVDLPPFWVVAVILDELGNRVSLLAEQVAAPTPRGTYEFVIRALEPNLRQGEYVVTFEILPELDFNWAGSVRLPYLCHWDRCVFFSIDERYRGSIELGRVRLAMRLTQRQLAPGSGSTVAAK